MASKSRKSAYVFSNDANKKNFDQTVISDSNLYPADRFNFKGSVLGDATVDEIVDGGWNANAQSAIVQLALASVLPINSVLMSTDGTNPFNTSQFNETITYEGTSGVTHINIYGIPVALEVGDSDNDIAEKVFNTMLATRMFDMSPSDHVAPSNTFLLKHKSSRPHNTEYTSTFTEILDAEGNPTGITAKSLVNGQSNGQTSLGYGEWELYHTDTTNYPSVMYFYRRIG